MDTDLLIDEYYNENLGGYVQRFRMSEVTVDGISSHRFGSVVVQPMVMVKDDEYEDEPYVMRQGTEPINEHHWLMCGAIVTNNEFNCPICGKELY